MNFYLKNMARLFVVFSTSQPRLGKHTPQQGSVRGSLPRTVRRRPAGVRARPLGACGADGACNLRGARQVDQWWVRMRTEISGALGRAQARAVNDAHSGQWCIRCALTQYTVYSGVSGRAPARADTLTELASVVLALISYINGARLGGASLQPAKSPAKHLAKLNLTVYSVLQCQDGSGLSSHQPPVTQIDLHCRYCQFTL